ncbi:unnamed protein product [Trichogramma brassicae]|uniref:Uncharacterized protein n=1 Tax=Trichogramma brassicae TaxID=86971 RepID=A0A6H5J376_9HYME|nr:unnamed protein product [Trichogramma brassicae]
MQVYPRRSSRSRARSRGELVARGNDIAVADRGYRVTKPRRACSCSTAYLTRQRGETSVTNCPEVVPYSRVCLIGCFSQLTCILVTIRARSGKYCVYGERRIAGTQQQQSENEIVRARRRMCVGRPAKRAVRLLPAPLYMLHNTYSSRKREREIVSACKLVAQCYMRISLYRMLKIAPPRAKRENRANERSLLRTARDYAARTAAAQFAERNDGSADSRRSATDDRSLADCQARTTAELHSNRHRASDATRSAFIYIVYTRLHCAARSPS